MDLSPWCGPQLRASSQPSGLFLCSRTGRRRRGAIWAALAKKGGRPTEGMLASAAACESPEMKSAAVGSAPEVQVRPDSLLEGNGSNYRYRVTLRRFRDGFMSPLLDPPPTVTRCACGSRYLHLHGRLLGRTSLRSPMPPDARATARRMLRRDHRAAGQPGRRVSTHKAPQARTPAKQD